MKTKTKIIDKVKIRTSVTPKEGEKHCSKCKKTKNEDQFGQNSRYCKACRAAYQRSRTSNITEKQREKIYKTEKCIKCKKTNTESLEMYKASLYLKQCEDGKTTVICKGCWQRNRLRYKNKQG